MHKKWTILASALTMAVAAAGAVATLPAAAASRPDLARHAAGRLVPHVAATVAVPTAMAAFEWSGDTTGFYSYNAAVGAASVSHVATGAYSVFFGGIGGPPTGTVDVTPYGTPGLCGANTWGAQGTNWGAIVFCDSLGGAPRDRLFTTAVTYPTSTPTGVFDFDFVGNPFPGPLIGPGQYNSSNKTNSLRVLGTGRYQITMPGPGTRGTTGTVKVSSGTHAGGNTPGDCEVAGWHGTTAGQVIDIDCFSATGSRQNRTFTLTYARRANLLDEAGLASAYAYASRPTASSYQPSTQFSSNSGATVKVHRDGRGQYRVTFSGSSGAPPANGGDVQVSTVGSNDLHCYVVSWASGINPGALVKCVSNSGATADSPFTIQWLVS